LSRRRIFELLEVAGPDDHASRWCDVSLITLISLNVLATIAMSVPAIEIPLRGFFWNFELISVGVFTVEYGLRLWACVESPDPLLRDHPLLGRLRYAASPIAVIDLLAILPFFAAAVVTIDLRFLRVLRVLRILKLSHYFTALNILLDVIRTERHAFGAAFFLLALGMLFSASGIYVFEHEAQPVAFGSIPAAMWWAVATLTTVGYGDVTPITDGGKIFAASVTVLSVGMVALPTGILASGFDRELRRRRHQYEAQLDAALEDGVIDDRESQELEGLRTQLGLSEEDVEEITSEHLRAPPHPPPDRPVFQKCPHCGGEFEAHTPLELP